MQKQMAKGIAIHMLAIMVLAIVAIQLPDKTDVSTTYTSEAIVDVRHKQMDNIVVSETKASPPVIEVQAAEQEPWYPVFNYSKDWDAEQEYMLAKIAMAEAEGENIQTKTLVILTVLNRVYSDSFPDTIEDVILQKDTIHGKTVYQFSPTILGGRWWTVEPNEDCWEAVKVVREAMYDYSDGALYFENCSNEDNWHSRNLELLYESDGMRFYK